MIFTLSYYFSNFSVSIVLPHYHSPQRLLTTLSHSSYLSLLTADVLTSLFTRSTEKSGRNSLNFQSLSSVHSYNHIFISICLYLYSTNPETALKQTNPLGLILLPAFYYFSTTHGSKKKPEKEVKNYFELDEIENTTYQSLWSCTKALLREQYIALIFCIRKDLKSKPLISTLRN